MRPSAVNLVPRLEYSTRSLSWAVQQYNSCKGQVDSYTVKAVKPTIRFGAKIIGGYSRCDYYTYTYTPTSTAIELSVTNGYMAGLGGFLQFMPNRLSNSRLAAQIEVLYVQHSFPIQYRHSHLSLPFMLQYALKHPKSSRYYPYLELGLQPNISLRASLDGYLLPMASNLTISLPIGIGIQPGVRQPDTSTGSKRRWSVGVRYFRLTNTFSNRINNICLYTGLFF